MVAGERIKLKSKMKEIATGFHPWVSIPKKDLKRILKRMELLSENPLTLGCEKLSGKNRYGLRQGRHCIPSAIRDDELLIWVVKVGHGTGS